MGIKHTLLAAPGVVLAPGDWNAGHVLDGTPGKLLMANGAELDPASLTVTSTVLGEGEGLLFAAASGSTVVVGATAIHTSGYSSAGVGGGRYIYDAAVTSGTVAANPRTQFLAADGRGFKLDPSQRLTIEMFGAIGDYVSAATPGTDNLAAINAATEFLPKTGFNYVPRVHFQGTGYYVSSTIEVRSCVHWVGEGSGGNISGQQGISPTRIIAPINTVVLRNHESRSTPTGEQAINLSQSATCSTYDGISFEQTSKGTDLNAHGFWMRGTAHLRNCTVRMIAGNGIHMDAAVNSSDPLREGDGNNWVVADCFAHTIGGDALHIDGNDGNAGYAIHFKTAGNTIDGCGIYDASSLGNCYISCQITGYGNTGVTDGTRRYVLIANDDTDIGLGSTTVPGTDNTIWYDIGEGGVIANQYPLWVSGTTYRFTRPILTIGASNISTFLGGYEELSFGGFCHLSIASMMFGGNFKCTEYSNHLSATAARGFFANNGIKTSYRSTAIGSTLYGNQGLDSYTTSGGPHRLGFDYPNSLMTAYREKDGAAERFHLDWDTTDNSIRWGYANRKNGFKFGGPIYANTHGRTAAQPYFMTFQDFCLNDSPTLSTIRTFGLRTASPAGDVATGDYFFKTDPSAGQVGWSIKAGGNPAATVAKDYLNERSSPSVGIGYVTLAGGAVTQATDKATGVTLNTVCGAITMNAASLAANTAVSFTLTDSTIAATDVVNVAIKSGATAGAYVVTVDAVAAGSCRISVRNLSTGALAEALVLNFAVVKAVAA